MLSVREGITLITVGLSLGNFVTGLVFQELASSRLLFFLHVQASVQNTNPGRRNCLVGLKCVVCVISVNFLPVITPSTEFLPQANPTKTFEASVEIALGG